MKYEVMLTVADKMGLTVKEKCLWGCDALIRGRNVAIRQGIPTSAEKAAVLAEEVGHKMTSAGNILDYSNQDNWKQEVKARTVGYDLMIGLDGIVMAYEAGCQNEYETAEYIGCPVTYLKEAINRYHEIYGLSQRCGDYIIFFEPTLNVVKASEKEERL